MMQMFVITLREGIEAFLIVAIALAYLRKTGRDALVPLFGGAGAHSRRMARDRRIQESCEESAAGEQRLI